jgi:hypothetical protein
MAHSGSEKDCLHHYLKAAEIIRRRCKNNDAKINDLRDVYEQRLNYAFYSIKRIPSTRGRIGSSCSESNHSSILINLNHGVRSINNYTEHPTTLFRDLLKRQSCHIKKWNESLFNENTRMKVIIDKLERSSPINHQLLAAAKELCLKSFIRFSRNWHRGNDDYTLRKGNEVHYPNNETLEPRVFEQNEDGSFSRCKCNDSLAFEEQCVHEIVLYRQMFKKNLFKNWHFRRECITCSSNPHLGNDNQSSVNSTIQSGQTINDHLAATRIGNDPFTNESKLDIHYNESDFAGNLAHDTSSSSQNVIFPKISKNEIYKLQAEISGNLKNCDDDTTTKVYALLLEINSVVMFNGRKPSNFIGNNDSASIDKMFCDINENHKKSFGVGSRNCFQPVNLSLTSPHQSVLQKQPKARLKPRIEMERTKFKKRQKTIPACTFCKEQGHRTTNCEKRSLLKNSGMEYTLCSDDRFIVHLRSLVESLEQHSCLQHMNYEWTTIDGIDTRYGFKSLVIEKAYSLENRVYGNKISMSSMFFSIKFLDKNANIIEENEPTIINGSKLCYYFQKAFETKNPTYIYNRCSEKDNDNGNGMIEQQLLLKDECPNYMFPYKNGLSQEQIINHGIATSLYQYNGNQYDTNYVSKNDYADGGYEEHLFSEKTNDNLEKFLYG